MLERKQRAWWLIVNPVCDFWVCWIIAASRLLLLTLQLLHRQIPTIPTTFHTVGLRATDVQGPFKLTVFQKRTLIYLIFSSSSYIHFTSISFCIRFSTFLYFSISQSSPSWETQESRMLHVSSQCRLGHFTIGLLSWSFSSLWSYDDSHVLAPISTWWK